MTSHDRIRHSAGIAARERVGDTAQRRQLDRAQQIGQDVLKNESVAIALPGFGVPGPAGFTASKDAYAEWLRETLSGIDQPVDVVGHDLGALLTLRVASALDVSVRSWAVDVANIFHPRFAWPQRVHELQTPELGEPILRAAREADPDDPRSTVSRLIGAGTPPELAREIVAAHNEVMSRSILDFYRSAAPNLAASWWRDTGPTHSEGLCWRDTGPTHSEGLCCSYRIPPTPRPCL